MHSSDYNDGGRDRLEGGAGEDVLIGGSAGDSIDGDSGDDLIFGDQAALERRVGDVTSLRFQALGGTLLYDGLGNVLLDGVARPYRDSGLTAPDWALFTIVSLLHSDAIAGAAVPAGKVQTYGDDYIAAGAGDDMVFGQLGNDVLLGDGALEDGPVAAQRLPGVGDPLGALILNAAIERLTDGDDYVEGGGGADLIFGGLGQDDLIGGSSSLFGLTTPGQRPDGSDYIFGGSGRRTGHNAVTGDLGDPHSADADAIVGDNGNIVRVVGTSGADLGQVAYGHDQSGRKIVVRAITLLDGAGADEIHGESGDDSVYAGAGNDRVFGDAEDDDLIGGAGHDWISGGTGNDGILGDDGRVRTHRGGVPEPLFGNPSAPGGVIKTTLLIAPESGGDDVIFGGLGDDVHRRRRRRRRDLGRRGAARELRRRRRQRRPDGDRAHRLHAALQPGRPAPLRPPRAGPDAADVRALQRGPPGVAHLRPAVATSSSTNDPSAGPKLPVVASDGDDRIAGNNGNDWIVGGTGRDVLNGGDGDDLLGADDDLRTGGGANLFQDTDAELRGRAHGRRRARRLPDEQRRRRRRRSGPDPRRRPDEPDGRPAAGHGRLGERELDAGDRDARAAAEPAARPGQADVRAGRQAEEAEEEVVLPKAKNKKKPKCKKKSNKKKNKKKKTAKKGPRIAGTKGRAER